MMLQDSPPSAGSVPTAADRRVEGWIRYLLTPGQFPPLRREEIRLRPFDRSPRKGRELAGTVQDLVRRLRGVTEADQEVDAILDRLARLASGDPDHGLPGAPSEGRDDLAAADQDELLDRLMEALSQVHDLRFGGRRLRFDPEPVSPRLVLDREEDGGLQLAWEPPALAWIPEGRGWVLDSEYVIHPLDDAIEPSEKALLFCETRSVDPGELAPLLRQLGGSADASLVLRSGADLPVIESPPSEARLLLLPRGKVLHLNARFVYDVGGLQVIASAEDPVPLLAFQPPEGGPVLLRRDVQEEERALAELHDLLGRRPPCKVSTDDALDLLGDRQDALRAIGWTLHEGDALSFRPVGELQANVRVGEATDWFDLGLSFSFEGVVFEAAEVLKSWREGRRWMALGDGRMARIPEQWLRQHGPLVEELVDLRGRTSSQGLAAALAAGTLLELAIGDGAAYWQAAARRAFEFEGITEMPSPPSLIAELRPYQLAGFSWLYELGSLGLGLCLADEMGLGKTLQALALLCQLHQDPGPPSMVVAPTSVLPGWKQHCEKFAPGLRIHMHQGPDRVLPPDLDGDIDLVITSYALLRHDATDFLAQPWRAVILDEAQYVKNSGSRTARVARGLRMQRRIALTGTPLENHLDELWSLFEFLNPGLLGTRAGFGRRFSRPIQTDGDPQLWDLLRRRIRPFMLRRLKKEVASELPPRTERVLYCDLGPAQRALYDKVRASYRESVLGGLRGESDGRYRIHVLEALLRLRQACCDPGILPFPEAREVKESAKLELLMSLLEEARSGDHRTLVFSQWPSLLRLVAARLDAIDQRYLFLDGSTRERGDLVDSWNDPAGPPTFLISLKAGGTGLNLPGADHVVHLDPWWNPAAEDQATDRAHRIGQTRPVLVDRIVARDTVEERILDLQGRKREIFAGAIDTDRLVADQLNRSDLESVFSLD